jgi:hypothetical protein
MGTKNQAAWALIQEAVELRDQGVRKEALWAALKDPMIERVKRAVAKAPNDPDVLLMGTWLLTPLAAAFPEPNRLIANYQQRLDQLGGPSDEVLAIVGGKDAYRRQRSVVKGTAGSGCLVAALKAVAVLAVVAVIASMW